MIWLFLANIFVPSSSCHQLFVRQTKLYGSRHKTEHRCFPQYIINVKMNLSKLKVIVRSQPVHFIPFHHIIQSVAVVLWKIGLICLRLWLEIYRFIAKPFRRFFTRHWDRLSLWFTSKNRRRQICSSSLQKSHRLEFSVDGGASTALQEL